MPTPHRDAWLSDLRATWPPVTCFGLTLDTAPLPALVEALLAYLEQADGPLQIVTLNPEILERTLANPHELELVKNAELFVADGVGITWAVRHLHGRRITTVAGVDLARMLLERSAVRGWQVFLLGSQPGIAEEAATKLRAAIPGVQIVGSDHGYHADTPANPKDETRVVNTLIALAPDILLVGMGSPKQEEFIARMKDSLRKTIFIGVGGSLDVYAGAVQRAPRIWQTCKLEWLYRMLSQPTRLKRLPTLGRFVLRVLRTPRS